MVDGGVPGTMQYAGYSRSNGKMVWAEVPQNYAELYSDYANPPSEGRRFGIWDIKDVVFTDRPDFDSINWKLETTLWGTRGKEGSSELAYVLLKDCEKEHLEKILDLTDSKQVKQVINHILSA